MNSLSNRLSIGSATFQSIVYDYNLFNEVSRHLLPNLNVKVILKRLIIDYNTIETFEFLALTRYERHDMYVALYELHIPYHKRRIDENFAVITLTINNDIRSNIIEYNLFQNQKIKNNSSNNLKQKLIISDIIYDIKDNITDAVFLQLMNTLSKITD